MDIRKYSVGNYGGTPGASVLQQYMPDVVRQAGIQGLQAIPGLQSGGTTYNAPYYQSLPLASDDKIVSTIVNNRLNTGFPYSNTPSLSTTNIQQNTPVQWEWDVDTTNLGYPEDYVEPKTTRTLAEVVFPQEEIFNTRKSILSRWNPETGFDFTPTEKAGMFSLIKDTGGGL